MGTISLFILVAFSLGQKYIAAFIMERTTISSKQIKSALNIIGVLLFMLCVFLMSQSR